MFHCRQCGEVLTIDDFFDLGLRLPDNGESHDEYVDAELIERVTHLRCIAHVAQIDGRPSAR